jgi:hypothetical protein
MGRPHSSIYEKVRLHDKPGFGFWGPARPLGNEEAERALVSLRELSGPLASWYRCQELTVVARGAADRKHRNALLREAFVNADVQAEPNRVVTVAAWPLRALLDSGETEWFGRELDRLLPVILAEPNPFRRQDGLWALLFTDAPEPWFERILALYRAACEGPQKTLTMRRVAAYVNRIDPERAVDLARLIHEPRRRRQALREIGAAPIME